MSEKRKGEIKTSERRRKTTLFHTHRRGICVNMHKNIKSSITFNIM